VSAYLEDYIFDVSHNLCSCLEQSYGTSAEITNMELLFVVGGLHGFDLLQNSKGHGGVDA